MQIITRHNKVIGYSNDGYVSVGSTAICLTSNKAYESVEISNVDCVPTDINVFDYYYIDGKFIKEDTKANICGTVTSQLDSYAEVFEWNDGNTAKEDRTGYFVTIEKTQTSTVISKASSNSKVFGVTVDKPGISTQASLDKFDTSGALYKKYSYVVANGIAKVRHDDTIVTGGFCVPNASGIATNSPNDYGYKVLYKLTSDLALIIVTANDDSIQRLKTDVETIRSHVGMIIQTTTLDTEDKVKAVYGGTSWSRLDNMFLVGAGTLYEVNSTGGEATHTLTSNEMPSHTHTFKGSQVISGTVTSWHTHGGSTDYAGSHNHRAFKSNRNVSAQGGGSDRNYCVVYTYDNSDTGDSAFQYNNTTWSSNHVHPFSTQNPSANHQHYVTAAGSNDNTGGGKAHNNLPPYKAVYIWERTA